MRKYAIAFILIIIVTIFFFVYQTRSITYTNDEYGISFKYSALYSEVYNEDTLISLKNSNSTIEIDVVAAKMEENYNGDIAKLGEGYVNLLKVFNEDISYEILSDKTIFISNNEIEARRVTFKVKNEEYVSVESAVLIPFENREITFIVNGTEDVMAQKAKQIDEMINSIAIY